MRFEFSVSESNQLSSLQKLDSKHLTEWACKQGWENWAHHSNCNNQNQKKTPFINPAVQSPHSSLPKFTNFSVPLGYVLKPQTLLSSLLSFPREKVPQGGWGVGVVNFHHEVLSELPSSCTYSDYGPKTILLQNNYQIFIWNIQRLLAIKLNELRAAVLYVFFQLMVKKWKIKSNKIHCSKPKPQNKPPFQA